MIMKNVTEALKWRYATKKFDPTKKINNEDLEDILEGLRLAPSSYGLQPWKFIIVNNTEVKLKIKEAAYGQSQIGDASHIIIFANKKNIDSDLVDEYMKFISVEKETDIKNLDSFSNMIKGGFSNKTNEELRGWAACQVYLAAGTLLTSCAFSGIDTCPMEGFDKTKVDEILGLPQLNLESKIIIVMGYRSEDDKSALSKKIRFPQKDVFIEIN